MWLKTCKGEYLNTEHVIKFCISDYEGRFVDIIAVVAGTHCDGGCCDRTVLIGEGYTINEADIELEAIIQTIEARVDGNEHDERKKIKQQLKELIESNYSNLGHTTHYEMLELLSKL